MCETPPPHVVVVDDDPSTLALLKRQLQNAGYEVSTFTDGRQALEAIVGIGGGIVISDWVMQVMDGLELCKALRGMRELQAVGNAYFILLTAHSSKEKIIEGLEAGADDYLTKPYHTGELLARIQVGERMLRLQDELVRRNIEVQKVNAQMAVLANKLDQLANTDGLTGLANRRCLFERYHEAWEDAQRDDRPLSVVMLDVDKFKHVNDTYGHAAGDAVLRTVAQFVSCHAPMPELCGRFGGEEFMVVCPGLPRVETAALAEQLRVQVAAQPVQFKADTISVTISCGVAETGAESNTAEGVIQHADAMLYKAKASGRNQTWVYGRDREPYPARDAQRAADATPAVEAGHGGGRRLQSAHANPAHER